MQHPAPMSARSRALVPRDGSPFWRGALTWREVDGLFQPWRLPPERARHAHAPTLLEMARMAAGVRAELVTDSSGLRLPLRFTGEEGGVVDLRVDGRLADRRPLRTGDHELEWELPRGVHEVRVWLPQHGHSLVGPLTTLGGDRAEPLPRRTRWAVYGSSITQCKQADGPSETWPAIVATTLGWDLVCLGFAGQCHLDPIVERAFEQLELDRITMCLGINSYGASTFSERSYAAQAAGFLDRVRDIHAEVPITVMTPISSPDREQAVNAVGITLERMRSVITDVARTLGDEGAPVDLVDGTTVLGIADAHLLADGLHPDAEGYRLMGERLAERLRDVGAEPDAR